MKSIPSNRMLRGMLLTLLLSDGLAALAEPTMATNLEPASEPVSEPVAEGKPQAIEGARSVHIVGEGQTLPQGVLRGRLIYKFAHSDASFSDFGGARSSGFKFNGGAAAAVVEYGITSAVSFQLVVPTVLQSQLSLDGSKFKDSKLFEKNYNSFLVSVAEKLVESGLCEDVDLCVAALDKQSLSMPYDKDVVLASGETLTLKQGIPIKTYAAPFIVNSILPSKGRTGLGDVETGLLVAIADPDAGLVRDWNTRMSVGLGVRWPTGSFHDVPRSQRATGRGLTDLGIRLNLDRSFSSALMLSAQHQSELMLFAGTKKRPSLIQSTELNRADPNTLGADGIGNDASYTRKRPRHLGFLKIAWHAGSISRLLDPIILNNYLKYDLDHPGELGGQSLGEQSAQYAIQFGVTYNYLQAKIPMQLDFDYEIPFSGKNKVIAAQVLTTSLKMFYRF